MLRSSICFLALTLAGCGVSEGVLTDDEFGESTGALTVSAESAAEILSLVNYPGTDAKLLDATIGLDARAAAGIIARRNGADGVVLTDDDKLFANIADLDAVPYVGDAAFTKLGAYAHAKPAPKGEVVEGVTFAGWESEIVAWGVSTLDPAVLNGMLDARAAANLVTNRPYVNVAKMGPVTYVGPAALERLRKEAKNWWQQRAGAVTLAGTFDGIAFDEVTAKRAIDIANTWSLAQFTGKGMQSQAASAIIGNRPFASVAAIANVGGVGQATMKSLHDIANSPVGPNTSIADVRAALETAAAGIWMPSETDAVIVYLQGGQLNGAQINEAVIRQMLTQQHDATIASVMYTDPSERSLAAKTQVEVRDCNDFLNRIIDNADPADEVSMENAQKFVNLRNALNNNLSDLKVYRFGRISISTFIVGRAPSGELVALLTGQVET
ncbi:MAG: nuclease A inhibitor family protein [Archangium sp.]